MRAFACTSWARSRRTLSSAPFGLAETRGVDKRFRTTLGSGSVAMLRFARCAALALVFFFMASLRLAAIHRDRIVHWLRVASLAEAWGGLILQAYTSGFPKRIERMTTAVAIIMGSQSDWETMRHAADTLGALGIASETRTVSAHRTPDR